MSKLVTNFGDSNTTGNVVLQQNLSVQGAFSTFYGNLLAGSAFSTIGNTTTKFNSIFAVNSNVTTTNTVGIFGPLGVVGVNTTPATGGANLQVQGNVWASNALTAPLIIATSLNAAMSNLLSIYGPTGQTGVGTSTNLGATLQIQGNVWVSNALTAPSIFATTSLNVGTANILSIYGLNGQTGVGTSTNLGATLHVQGNVYASNAIQSPVILATTSLNAVTANILSIFGTAGRTGIGTSTNLGATLQVQGNVWVSNAVQATNVVAITLNTTTTNTLSIYGTTGQTGVGTSTNLGATLHVQGNLYASNTLTAPNVFATTSLNASTTNVLGIFGQSGFVGVGTSSALGATLHVQGNVYASNAIQAPSIIVTFSLNSATANILSIYGPAGKTGVGTSTNLGATLHVLGNVYASNAIQSPNLIITNSLNVATLNVTNIFGTANVVGIGLTPLALGASLQIQGNVWASNALSAPLILATNSLNTSTANILGIYGPTGQTGVGTSTNLGATLHVLGNVYASNAIQSPNLIITNSLNVATLNVTNIFGTANVVGIGLTPLALGASLQIQGNVWASNALSAPLILATNSLNTSTANILGIYGPTGQTGVGTSTNLGATLHVLGNVYASNALTAPAANINVATITSILTVSSMYGPVGLIGIGTTVSGSTLDVNGNVYAANAISAPTVFATTSLNAATVNVLAIWGTSGRVGVNTTTPGATLEVNGNLFASNALTAPTVIAQTGNTTVMNVLAIFGPGGFTGIGTTGPSSTLDVLGNVFVSNAVLVSNLVTDVLNVAVLNTNSIFGSAGFIGVGTATASATLHIQGNLYASNAFQTTNVIATTANITTINVTSLYGTNGLVGVNTTTPCASLDVRGNIYASNSIQTTNVVLTGTMNVPSVNATSIFGTTGLVGINTTTPGSSLDIRGNLYASNSISVTNVIATTANAQVMNVRAIYGLSGLVGIGTSTNLGATLHVQGNIWVSNSLTAQYYTALNANVTTLNVATISAQTNQTINFTGSLNLVNNIYVANTLTASNVFAGTLYYNTDQTKRGAYLTANVSNATIIQTWIGATTNLARNSWWSASSRPVFGNVGSVAGLGYGRGSLLLPDGRVLMTPSTSNIGIFNPATNQFTVVTPSGDRPGGAVYMGSVLTPSGNVICIPSDPNANIGSYNPNSLVFSNVARPGGSYWGGVLDPLGNVVMVPATTSSNIFTFNPNLNTLSNISGTNFDGSLYGAVLLPNGNVVCVPRTNANIVQFNPRTQTTSNSINLGESGTAKFFGGVLAPNGNVICVPASGGTNSNVGVFNPTTLTYSNVQTNTGVAAFYGGCLLPTGNVVFSPYSTANVGMFDPSTLTFSNSTNVGGTTLFWGGTLVPDGRVIFCPFQTFSNVGALNTVTPAPREFCLAPYFNKL